MRIGRSIAPYPYRPRNDTNRKKPDQNGWGDYGWRAVIIFLTIVSIILSYGIVVKYLI